MSLRKFCSSTLAADHPMRCANSPDCEHHWFYDFRVNRRRYRNTTETANKQEAKKIEARERSRVLENRHGIRRQPDITFKAFAQTYLDDYSKLNKRSVVRDEFTIKVLNRAVGSLLLHEITAHRIEQFKRERLAGRWRGHNYKSTKPIRPATVNRELDTLRSIFSKAVEWGKLVDHPMRAVKRLKVDNRRTRILTAAEQLALLDACPKKLRRLVQLALLTGARVGELLSLKWADVTDTEMVFWNTKNGRTRRLPMSADLSAILTTITRGTSSWLFTNPRTHEAYTVNGMAHTFRRAVTRAGITSGDVSLHNLRHTALSRMIEAGLDDHTVKDISGHSSTRMLERYTHPTQARKAEALTLAPSMGRIWAEREIEEWKKIGGRREDRTRDLCIANAHGRKRQRDDS